MRYIFSFFIIYYGGFLHQGKCLSVSQIGHVIGLSGKIEDSGKFMPTPRVLYFMRKHDSFFNKTFIFIDYLSRFGLF